MAQPALHRVVVHLALHRVFSDQVGCDSLDVGQSVAPCPGIFADHALIGIDRQDPAASLQRGVLLVHHVEGVVVLVHVLDFVREGGDFDSGYLCGRSHGLLLLEGIGFLQG